MIWHYITYKGWYAIKLDQLTKSEEPILPYYLLNARGKVLMRIGSYTVTLHKCNLPSVREEYKIIRIIVASPHHAHTEFRSTSLSDETVEHVNLTCAEE